MKRRTNKTIAGYHLLMILSAVDYKFSIGGDMVIREFLVKEFPFEISLDKEMAVISALKSDEWESHFLKNMDDFYDDATEEERLEFLQFALKLTKADNVITPTENYYLNLLFDSWNVENKEA
ncbi:MAG TPA: hypothetical protein PKX92_09345 [Edaphocola sp.]|nr:hypothetical protein [Edaphocola sp.]